MYFYTERRWVIVFAFLVMLLTTIPYLLGYASQGDGWRFSGFVFGVEDGNSYIAKMLSGAYGSWLFRTPYTTFPQRGVIAFFPYIILGKLASAPGLHEQLVVIFHLFRIVAGFLFILASYDFISFYIRDIAFRRIGIVMATIGGGLGWILLFSSENNWTGSLPLEYYSPESFGFLSLYGLPHLALARALLLWGLVIFLTKSSTEQPVSIRDGMGVGLLWLLAAIAQPLSAIVIGIVISGYILFLAVWQGWRHYKKLEVNWLGWRRRLYLALWSSILPLPFLLYNAIMFATDPFLKAWTSQNKILSPHPLHYLLAYGCVLPLVIIGAVIITRNKPWAGWLLVFWLIAFPLLVYSPVNLQRRLAEGIWIVMIILALIPLERWKIKVSLSQNKLQQTSIQFISILIIILAIPSTILLLFGGMQAAVRPNYPLFQRVEQVKTYQYIVGQDREGDVLLSAYEIGNALPAWAPVRVVNGHGPESVGLSDILREVGDFYDTSTEDPKRIEFLERYHVNYVYWGPNERKLGDWNPSSAEFLNQVYQSGEYELFEVSLEK